MSVEIVRIGASNRHALTRVAADVFDDDIDPERLAAYCAMEEAILVVAIADGVVVGQARGYVHRQPDSIDHFYIDNLGVTPDRRRQGIATRLMQALLREAKACGCKDIWLAASRDNQEGRAFYRAFGLIESGVFMFANFADGEN